VEDGKQKTNVFQTEDSEDENSPEKRSLL